MLSNFLNDSVGTKPKAWISKRVLQKKSPPDFPKNEHILSPDKHTCVRIRRKEMFLFRKIWRVLFSCNTRFEIRPFTVLPTSKELVFPDLAITLWYALREKLNMIFKKIIENDSEMLFSIKF